MSNDSRIDELEKRVAELEEKNRQLEKRNNKLEAKNAMNKRELVHKIDRDKYEYLFNFAVDRNKGTLISAERETTANNFSNFYRNILKALMPTPCRDSDKRAKYEYSCKCPNLNTLSDKQWNIVSDAIVKIVNTAFTAKTKLDNSDEPLPLTGYKE